MKRSIAALLLWLMGIAVMSILISCAPRQITTDTPPQNHKRMRLHVRFTEDCKDNTMWEMAPALTTPSGYATAVWRFNPYIGLFEVGVETDLHAEYDCPMLVEEGELWWVDIYDDRTTWWIHLSNGKEYRIPKQEDIHDYTVEFCHSRNYNYLYSYDRH